MVLLAFAEGTSVQLLPDFSMLIHIALVLLMIFILNRTFFRPVNRVIEARLKRESGGFTEAEEILNQISEKQAGYTAALLEARNEGYELIEKERAEALRRREAEISGIKEQVAKKVAEEKAELERQTAEARAQIDREADEMAEKISRNILKAA
ncbi:MAG TPA: hypothetical protein VK892_01645 [Pyrinomonadaceae bacterium]|nr:hypothetical protein [Pyrinomonadaceae bacterium]